MPLSSQTPLVVQGLESRDRSWMKPASPLEGFTDDACYRRDHVMKRGIVDPSQGIQESRQASCSSAQVPAYLWEVGFRAPEVMPVREGGSPMPMAGFPGPVKWAWRWSP